eukprot:766523-Hanusia_phi.AAC.2
MGDEGMTSREASAVRESESGGGGRGGGNRKRRTPRSSLQPNDGEEALDVQQEDHPPGWRSRFLGAGDAEGSARVIGEGLRDRGLERSRSYRLLLFPNLPSIRSPEFLPFVFSCRLCVAASCPCLPLHMNLAQRFSLPKSLSLTATVRFYMNAEKKALEATEREKKMMENLRAEEKSRQESETKMLNRSLGIKMQV